MALLHARTAAATLPEREAAFLRDNLIYQGTIMLQTGEWLESVLRAGAVLELGEVGVCAEELARAEAAFAQLPVLAQDYCRGPWENWYRGCKKLNVAATLQKTRDVLEQARKAQTHAAQRKGKP